MTGDEAADPDDQAGKATDAWGALSGLPGNPMMWILILGEMAVFGVALVGFAVARALDPPVFQAAQAELHPWIAGLNTAVLVTSGYLVALAVRRRELEQRRGRWLMGAAMMLGAVFLALKVVEYAALFKVGIGIESNMAFRLYFLITGFHALHIVFGIVILGIVAIADSLDNMETGAAFWHMLDLVWVLIYPVIYLLP